MQAKMLKILTIVIAAAIATGIPSAAAPTVADSPAATVAPTASAAPADSVTLSARQVADLLIDEAYKHIGKPYRYGARGPKAFDCSGFTSYVYRQLGISISHSSKEQAKDGRAVEGTYADLQKGDIIILGARASRKSVGHVGLFIEMSPDGQDFTFIHAATHGGVTVSHITEEYYAVRFLGARRVLPDFEIEVPEPEDNTLDFEATYGNVFLPIKDTLSLSAADSRLVLFGDGTWATLNDDGTLSAPAASPAAAANSSAVPTSSPTAIGSRIVLNPNGTWQPLSERSSSVRLPSLAATSVSGTTSSASGSVARTSSGSTAGRATQPTSSTANSSATTSSTQNATAETASGSTSEAQYHTIKSGDTLDKISKIYGTTIDRLCELNGITRKTILHIGRRLRVR